MKRQSMRAEREPPSDRVRTDQITSMTLSLRAMIKWRESVDNRPMYNSLNALVGSEKFNLF